MFRYKAGIEKIEAAYSTLMKGNVRLSDITWNGKYFHHLLMFSKTVLRKKWPYNICHVIAKTLWDNV